MFKKGALTRFWIKTILYHDRICASIFLYVMVASIATVAATLLGAIPLGAMFRIMGFGTLGIVLLLSWLINTRRVHLKYLDDPVLKEDAHNAMIIFLEKRKSKMTKKELDALYGVRGGKYLKKTLWYKRNKKK